MLDEFKKIFMQKEGLKDKNEKVGIPLEALKKKVLEEFNKLKPEQKEEKKELTYSVETSNPEYTEDHGQNIKKFLSKPSVDKMNSLKSEGRWNHLNKIFAQNYEQE